MNKEKILASIDTLRAEVLALQDVPREVKLQDREYGIGRVQRCRPTVSGVAVNMAEYKNPADEPITPGEEVSILFGEDFVLEGSGVPGLPETDECCFGVKTYFRLESLVIDDECAPHFSVSVLAVGAETMWGYPSVPGTRFAASAPRVNFNKTARPRIVVSAMIKNTSKEPRVFRAKIVGKEPVGGEEIKK